VQMVAPSAQPLTLWGWRACAEQEEVLWLRTERLPPVRIRSVRACVCAARIPRPRLASSATSTRMGTGGRYEEHPPTLYGNAEQRSQSSRGRMQTQRREASRSSQWSVLCHDDWCREKYDGAREWATEHLACSRPVTYLSRAPRPHSLRRIWRRRTFVVLL